MSACEECWTEASRRAALSSRMTAEIYPEVLRENDGKHDAENTYCDRGPCSNVAGHDGACSL